MLHTICDLQALWIYNHCAYFHYILAPVTSLWRIVWFTADCSSVSIIPNIWLVRLERGHEYANEVTVYNFDLRDTLIHSACTHTDCVSELRGIYFWTSPKQVSSWRYVNIFMFFKTECIVFFVMVADKWVSLHRVGQGSRFNIDTLRQRQTRRHFADDTFNCIFLNENARITIEISLKFVPTDPIDNIPALVQIMGKGGLYIETGAMSSSARNGLYSVNIFSFYSKFRCVLIGHHSKLTEKTLLTSLRRHLINT